MATPPAAAAAAASKPKNDDMTVARQLHTLEQLTQVYGFSKAAAQQAMEALDSINVTECCNYILDQGLGQDQGGPITPISHCPHMPHFQITSDQLPLDPQSAECTHQETTTTTAPTGGFKADDDNHESCPLGENWLCLECGVVRCSRYINGHALAHYQDTSHCLAVSLADLSVWCHVCQAYIQNDVLHPILAQLAQRKFRQQEPERKKQKQNEQDSKDDQEEEQEQVENESDDSEDEKNLFQMIAAAAAARGIPLEFLAANENDDDDHQDLEYHFESRPSSLEDVTHFIQSEACQKILILAGAGMSCEAGIPDFRSADGLYATMNPDQLTANDLEKEVIRNDPTVALEQNMFLQNPLPCLELQREFILGTRAQRWKATLAHRFVELLHAKTGKLVRLYTQNIDGLEDQCLQLPRTKVIAVHGSMDRAECAMCHTESNFENFTDCVQRQIKDLSGQDGSAPSDSTPIACDTCGYNAMKPAIVLFRSSLPKEFFDNIPKDVQDVDLLIVIGTSLRVAPANSLVWRVPKSSMRLLVNREEVGWHLGMHFGEESTRDYHAAGNCDAVLLDLMEQLGWLDDLKPLLEHHKLPETSAQMLRERLEQRGQSAEESEHEEAA